MGKILIQLSIFFSKHSCESSDRLEDTLSLCNVLGYNIMYSVALLISGKELIQCCGKRDSVTIDIVICLGMC